MKQITYTLKYLLCLPLIFMLMCIVLTIGIITPDYIPDWLDAIYDSWQNFILPREVVR